MEFIGCMGNDMERFEQFLRTSLSRFKKRSLGNAKDWLEDITQR